MGLDMNFYVAKKDFDEKAPNAGLALEFGNESYYFSKSAYPLHHWITSHVGKVEDCELKEVSRENILALRDTFIDILQNATDGAKVTDVDYVKQRIWIFEDKDVDFCFVGFIDRVIDVTNTLLYLTDFDTEKVLYCASW